LAKPVRPEEVRSIVERWGSAIASGPKATDDSVAAAPAAAAPVEEKVTPPVDMERLKELTDGTEVGVRDLVKLYIEQTGQQLQELEAAIRAGQTAEVRRLAHSCAGASATCGMGGIVPMMREMEKQGYEGRLTTTEKLFAESREEFARICAFLAPYAAVTSETPQT
jgi:HPt (histidine-containing phosphotransfer) domain-containing protein